MTQQQLLNTLPKFLGAVCMVHGTLWFFTILCATLSFATGNAGKAYGFLAMVPIIEIGIGYAIWAKFAIDEKDT
ncbi:MAG: hypothetical protein K6T83_11215 [Alicyclobacillus sp.]|nr:hypothetical protein [Alicyclobacillus sp.]